MCRPPLASLGPQLRGHHIRKSPGSAVEIAAMIPLIPPALMLDSC